MRTQRALTSCACACSAPAPTPACRKKTACAVYQHACLLYQRGERLTNASLRQRLGLAGNQVAQVSRLIAQARDRALIRPADDGERAYVPDWVGRAGVRGAP